jgi:hypothetical protein
LLIFHFLINLLIQVADVVVELELKMV